MIKILLVDDEEDVRTSFRRFLQKEEYTIKEASNGKEALAFLEKSTFDLLILDILMPGMTGVELAKTIRANPKTKNQKIIFATVVPLADDSNKEIKSIAPAAYVTKPFKLEDLRKAIKKALVGAKG